LIDPDPAGGVIRLGSRGYGNDRRFGHACGSEEGDETVS
jgi:hypothetical protein